MKKKEKAKNKNKKKIETIDKIIFTGFALIIVVFVLIALFAMNVFNLKTTVVDRVTKQLIENQENAAEAYVGEEMVRQYKEMIGKEFLRINAHQEELTTREESLNQREAAIATEEESIQKNKDEIERLLKEISGDHQDIEELSSIVENMAPENAATMLTEIEDLKLVRNVVFNIGDEDGAAILENLEPSLAAKIVLERFNNTEEIENLLESEEPVEETQNDQEVLEENQEDQEGGEIISGGGSSE
jgi:flagellar motility protein MotE (MotC chaperone)